MILVDTSVWISFLRNDDPDLSDILRKYLKTNEIVTVSAVFGELLQGVKSNRERNVVQVIWESLPKTDESNLFIEAGFLSNKHKFYAHGVGLIDCYILSACMKEGHALWTLDKKLLDAFDQVMQ